MSRLWTSLFVVFLSIQSQGRDKAPDYVGLWCGISAQNNEVMVIDENDGVKIYEQRANDVDHRLKTAGYVSLGATHFHLYINNISTGVIDYNVTKTGPRGERYLHLYYVDRADQVFRSCSF